MPLPATTAVAPPPGRLDRKNMRRLPGRQSMLNLVGSYRLWLAPDFLLQLKSTGYVQDIQRFSYLDIQALEICKSMRGLIYNIVFGLPLAGLGLLAIFGVVGMRNPFLLVCGAVCLTLLAINTARGPTCHCVLLTALGAQVLPSLSRQRAARRAVALVAARVEAVQGR